MIDGEAIRSDSIGDLEDQIFKGLEFILSGR